MRRVCEDAIQVHGGIGFTWEAGIHLHYRRVLQLQASLGGAVASARAVGRRELEWAGA
jgi:alkylation response protein AidB-like acyl-CoA dehydrogenase